MAKSTIILVSALCFISLFHLASCKDQFFVEGKVYCDTCRVQFFTKVSKFLEGILINSTSNPNSILELELEFEMLI